MKSVSHPANQSTISYYELQIRLVYRSFLVLSELLYWVMVQYVNLYNYSCHTADVEKMDYVGHLESKERLRIQPAQLFNFS